MISRICFFYNAEKRVLKDMVFLLELLEKNRLCVTLSVQMNFVLLPGVIKTEFIRQTEYDDGVQDMKKGVILCGIIIKK